VLADGERALAAASSDGLPGPIVFMNMFISPSSTMSCPRHRGKKWETTLKYPEKRFPGRKQ